MKIQKIMPSKEKRSVKKRKSAVQSTYFKGMKKGIGFKNKVFETNP
jgi:hypothetical protein